MDFRPSFSTGSANFKSWQVLLVLVAVLILGVGAVAFQTNKRSSRPPSSPDQNAPEIIPDKKPPLLSPSASLNSLVYGSWENGSTIKTINNDGSNHASVAQLALNIKDVNVISSQELIYIAETNDQDHGQKVNFFDLQTGQSQTLFEASTDFGIDDLVLSPDKTWVAVWEVKFAPGAKILSGGDSRVYTVNLANPQNKILVADEKNISDTNFLHYPLFFDFQNRLYLDTFGPNGGGWNRGLWVLNSDGSGLLPVAGMNDGDYSSDPIVSPDGTRAIIIGYDPTAPIQLADNPTSGILRPAIANPNLLQIMDLASFQKTTLSGSENGSQYDNPVWSSDGTKIAFRKLTASSSSSLNFAGVYIYDLPSSQVAQILDPQNYPSVEVVGFNQTDLLWGQPTENTSNLGGNYQSVFDSFFVTSLTDQTTLPVLAGPALQFIDYLDKTPGSASAMNVSALTAKPTPPASLKLNTFAIKPIAEVRNPQQNNRTGLPRCRDILPAERRTTKCSDSPLYLYPEKETLVTVKVNPPAEVIQAEPAYGENGWQVLAQPNGKLTANDGEVFDKISYLYSTDSESPDYGLIVKKEDLKQILPAYAELIGLQGQEVTDFTSFWLESLPDNSPYYLVSHFDQARSKAMMPLEINPRPDVLIQTIMYFQLLEKPITVKPPIFENVWERFGFTAVDWSGIIE